MCKCTQNQSCCLTKEFSRNIPQEDHIYINSDIHRKELTNKNLQKRDKDNDYYENQCEVSSENQEIVGYLRKKNDKEHIPLNSVNTICTESLNVGADEFYENNKLRNC